MDVLPLEKVAPEEVDLLGQEIVNLAVLSRAGLRVASGIVVIPPEIKLRTVLKHHNLADKEIFEQSLTIIRKEISEIEVPEELISALKSRKINPKTVWLKLLDVWLDELRSAIWREGLSQGLSKNLEAQTVFWTDKVEVSGQAFIDPSDNELKIETSLGSLSEAQKSELGEMVREGNKKLFLPKIYHFIVEKKSPQPKIVKLAPYTGTAGPVREFSFEDLGLSEKVNFSEKNKEARSTLRIFLDFSKGLVVKSGVDGILICAEKLSDFEEKVFKVVEAAESFPDLPIIYKLSDQIEKRNGVRGSLRLLHQEKLLKEDASVVTFSRHKKNLLNVSVAVPFVRSLHEFLKIKRDLSTLGISRKGSLKLWLEIAVPENIINIEDYLTAGLDGVIINLDELASLLGGFDPGEPESVFYKAQVSGLIKFISDALKVLHKAKIPTIFSGNLALHDEILELAFEKGVTGVVADFVAANSLNEHLQFVEKRLIRRRLS